jgi:hypothetical protein
MFFTPGHGRMVYSTVIAFFFQDAELFLVRHAYFRDLAAVLQLLKRSADYFLVFMYRGE